jgi:hypothetical protein
MARILPPIGVSSKGLCGFQLFAQRHRLRPRFRTGGAFRAVTLAIDNFRAAALLLAADE